MGEEGGSFCCRFARSHPGQLQDIERRVPGKGEEFGSSPETSGHDRNPVRVRSRDFWNEVHNAGFLKSENTVTIRYPFHPLVAQSVLVVGSTEHRGYRPLIMRKPNSAKILLPKWMTTAEGGAIQTVSSPRLSINKLLELRAFLDRHMTSSEDQLSGGVNDETLETTRTRSVQDTW
jgi:hypothetical protein